MEPLPKRNPTPAEPSPAEKAQELSMYNHIYSCNCIIIIGQLYDLLATYVTYTAIDDHIEVTEYLLNLKETDFHNLGLTCGLYCCYLKQ